MSVDYKWTSEQMRSWLKRVFYVYCNGCEARTLWDTQIHEYQAFAHTFGRDLVHPHIGGIRGMRGKRTNADIRKVLEWKPIPVAT